MKSFMQERRDAGLVPVISILGIVLIFASGSLALRLRGTWRVAADMESMIDPNGGASGGLPAQIVPLRPEIQTLPPWADYFLTPGADDPNIVPIGRFTPVPTFTPTPTLRATPTETATPTMTASSTSTATNTPYFVPTYWPTATPTRSVDKPTKTPKQNPTQTPTNTPKVKDTRTPKFTPTFTPTYTPTSTTPPVIEVDLAISKDDRATTYAAGSSITYTVIVTNAGINDVLGATVTDGIPVQVQSWDWACTTVTNASGCDAVTNSTADFTDDVDIKSGGSIEYTVTAVIANDANGELKNTADVAVPSGYKEINLGNNSSSDTDIPYIDLQITKDDGRDNYTAGGNLTYIVTVTNASTFNLSGVSVIDNVPALIVSWNWSCTPDPGATCTSSGSGNINDLGDLPAGASVVYKVDATVHANATGNLENIATVSPPLNYVDAVSANDSAKDSDVNQAGEPDVGPPDGGVYPIGNGGSATFYLSQPIIANGDAAADFVFYESANSPGIHLDQTIIEISSDGATWYPVFYWGDNIADTNSDADYINVPSINSACPTEIDNCPVPSAVLYPYPGIGIAIDVDNSPLSPGLPNGVYFWIKFTEPGLSGSDGTHVDAIQILP